MDYNDYYVEWYVRDLLAAARAEVRRNALIPPRAPIVRPALATDAAALRKVALIHISSPRDTERAGMPADA
jgi:hypothetical protein